MGSLKPRFYVAGTFGPYYIRRRNDRRNDGAGTTLVATVESNYTHARIMAKALNEIEV